MCSNRFTNINLHKNDVAPTVIPILQIKRLSTKISNLLKVTQLVSGKVRNQSQESNPDSMAYNNNTVASYNSREYVVSTRRDI